MKRMLKLEKKELIGIHKKLTGDFSGLYEDCYRLTGNCNCYI